MGNILQQRKVQFALLFIFTLTFLIITAYTPFFDPKLKDMRIARIDSPESGDDFVTRSVEIVIFLNADAIKSQNRAELTRVLVSASSGIISETIYSQTDLSLNGYKTITIQHIFQGTGEFTIKLYAYYEYLDYDNRKQNVVYTDSIIITILE